MDKKFYLEPEMEVVELKMSGVLCNSLTEDGDINDNNQPPVDNNPGTEDDF